MHKMTCTCAKCTGARRALLANRKGSAPAGTGRLPLSEQEEMELAMELLEISDEEEWEQFLGKVFKKIGRGIKKAGRFVGRKVLPKLGGALKGLAKKALPFVGGALGSLIPVPGVGTAIGTAVGSAASPASSASSRWPPNSSICRSQCARSSLSSTAGACTRGHMRSGPQTSKPNAAR